MLFKTTEKRLSAAVVWPYLLHRFGGVAPRLGLRSRGEREVMELVVVRTQQRQFSGVVKDYLRRIHYGVDGWADSVRLPTYANAKVIVDPKVAFGLPIVAHGGARVEDLVDRFQAGDSVAEIATDFSVPPDEVEDVLRLATRTAA
jgi:uncharacterized protein (DUF433 family)